MYKTLAKINKVLLPSLTKQNTNIAKAKKGQQALLAYRYFVTIRAITQ